MVSFKKIHLFIEREEGREKEGEGNMGCVRETAVGRLPLTGHQLGACDRGSMEPAAFQFAGRCSVRSAAPARAAL